MSKVNLRNLPLLGDQVKLHNGDLVIASGAFAMPRAFLVTSFRNQTNNHAWTNTATYCSLVRLDNGYIDFEEPCSRNTNVNRILHHLNDGSRTFESVMIVPKDGYSINVTIDQKE